MTRARTAWRYSGAGGAVLTLADSPDLVALHAAHPERYPHLLQSVTAGAPHARYDILFAFPGSTLVREPDGHVHLDGRPVSESGFLHAFASLWRRAALATPRVAAGETPLPFSGGWFVFLGYELAQEIEPLLHGLPHDPTLPAACAVRFPAAVIRDHIGQRTYLIAEPGAEGLIAAMQVDIRRLRPAAIPGSLRLERLDEEPPEAFLEQVRRVKAYIAAGDVFQVNLSRRWRARLARVLPPAALHRRLAAANPAPFAALATFPDGRAIVSSSPERLVEVRGRTIRTRPIAGTYPRSPDAALDRAWSQELLRHPKERAEHVMLIDLERNDLGRVCRAGTVKVSELMTVESYRHVHHIVSEVRGELHDDADPAKIVRAVFPGGTITGCPKVRCMQIIAELERSARGAYTGSLGYVNHDGSMDLNILIRTLVLHDDEVCLRAGAGIVADSVPERELAETRAKARGMLAALGAEA